MACSSLYYEYVRQVGMLLSTLLLAWELSVTSAHSMGGIPHLHLLPPSNTPLYQVVYRLVPKVLKLNGNQNAQTQNNQLDQIQELNSQTLLPQLQQQQQQQHEQQQQPSGILSQLIPSNPNTWPQQSQPTQNLFPNLQQVPQQSQFQPIITPQNQFQSITPQNQFQSITPQNQFQPNPQQNQFQPNPQQNQFQPNPQQNQFQPNPQQNQFQPNLQQNQFQPNPQQNQFQPNPQQNQFQPIAPQNQFQSDPQHHQFQPMIPQNQYPSVPQQNQLQPATQPNAYIEQLSSQLKAMQNGQPSQQPSKSTPPIGSYLSSLQPPPQTMPQNQGAMPRPQYSAQPDSGSSQSLKPNQPIWPRPLEPSQSQLEPSPEPEPIPSVTTPTRATGLKYSYLDPNNFRRPDMTLKEMQATVKEIETHIGPKDMKDPLDYTGSRVLILLLREQCSRMSTLTDERRRLFCMEFNARFSSFV